MNQLVEKLKIEPKDVLVDNGENDFWHKSWYETRYGLMDSNGYFVVPAIFKDISVSEDMFIATYHSKGGKKIFFINQNGKVVTNNAINIIDAKDFKNGCSIIQTADIFDGGNNVPWTYVSNLCKWGLMDKFGNILVAPVYDYEYQVKIKDVEMLCNEVKLLGCGVLNYAHESLFSNMHNIVKFRRAIKLYLISSYAKSKDKEQLKFDVEQQNKQFQKIKARKLAENLFVVKIDKIDSNQNQRQM